MRKKAERMIILLMICTLISCLFVTDYAYADKKFQTKVSEISYSQANNTASPTSFMDLFERVITLRDDIINVIDHFSPDMASQMQQKNDLMKDLLQILNDLPRKTQSP